MKTFRLLIVSLLLATSASAQHHRGERRGGDYSPTVYLISVHEVDTIYNCGGCAAQQAAALNRMAVGNATQDYIDTHRPGFQQTEKPQFVFASKNNRFSFSIGGFVSLRAGYDFDGIVDNIDFVPYDIPVPGNYNSKQKLMMDASTSRLFLKAITNTRALGRVVIYMDADFRGGAEGSYTPRLRSAYVSFKGLTLGRDVTTFCDLSAAPTTIDFQGPNAYNFNFATLIRYEVSFARRHMTFGVAAELPSVSATYGENFKPIHQRVPDFPMYLQYAWGADRSSHLRASAVLRNPYMYKVSKDATTSLFGWGVQLSGTIKCCDWFRMFMNGVYGKGITLYPGSDRFGARLHAQPGGSHARAHDAHVGRAGRRADQLHAAPVRVGRLLDGARAAQRGLLYGRPVQTGAVYLRQHLLLAHPALQGGRRVPLRFAQGHEQHEEPCQPRERDGAV
ncbi:MAG: DcaP family trimeric outer membrane transporter [Alistipes onderdonkii]